MQERHTNRKQYFLEQAEVTEKYVIPYILEVKKLDSSSRILEIGCGEGGNMLPFLKQGYEVIGVDLNGPQIEKAKEYIQEFAPNANIKLYFKDIYLIDPQEIGKFDLVILRDVIEHIHNQEKFMGFLKNLLSDDGVIFFGFPPWRMPFGGHQQICQGKLLSKLPYFHLLPMSLYKFVLKTFGESEGVIESLVEIKETGISTRRFEKIVRENKYQYLKKTRFLINPNYEIKFGLKPRILNGFIASIYYFRDFVTTCFYCVIKK